MSLSVQDLPDLEVQYLGKGKGVMLAATQLSDSVGLKIGGHMRCVHRLLHHDSTCASHKHIATPDESFVSIQGFQVGKTSMHMV